mmetsp:Transcript_36202/g.105977  ORF Transcript_36202/g.105977 Transcript_36202/m.105977 type:complete len:132 (+) Transcript_36202:2-397(+)
MSGRRTWLRAAPRRALPLPARCSSPRALPPPAPRPHRTAIGRPASARREFTRSFLAHAQLQRAKTIKEQPILWIANEADERAPLDEARHMFDHLAGMQKVLHVLPGGRGAMRCCDVSAQLSWLMERAHERG